MVTTRRRLVAEAKPRQIERAEGIKLCQSEPLPEILAGPPHAGGDRTAPLHEHQRIHRTIRPRRPARGIRYDRWSEFDRPMPQPLRTDNAIFDHSWKLPPSVH